jgi:hypothetical protein
LIIIGKQVNQRELAEICGVTDVTIWEWQGEGLPIVNRGERGESNVYDTGAVIDWRIERALARSGTTKAQVELEIMKLDLKKKRAEDSVRENTLVPVDQVRPIWESRIRSAAAYMTGRASQLAGLLETVQGIEAKRAELKRSDSQFLSHLGVHGDKLQTALEEFLAASAPEAVHALFRAMDMELPNESRGS